jgi:hypothetical protein
MSVDHDALAGSAAEQLVDGKTGNLALDIPESDIDGRDGGHGDRATTPVGTLVQVVPEILDAVRGAADQQWADVVAQVGRHSQFTPIERGIPDPGHPGLGLDDKGHVVAPWRADDDACVDDLHLRAPTSSSETTRARGQSAYSWPPRTVGAVSGNRIRQTMLIAMSDET